jgi:hypothetical protein
LSYFKIDQKFRFYLQKAFVKDLLDNSMLFLEVENLEAYFDTVQEKNLITKNTKVKHFKIVDNDWLKELFLRAPSRIFWHFVSSKE